MLTATTDLHPTLRLFVPGDAPPVPSLSLSQFYDAWVLPRYRLPRGASPQTITQDRETLRLWEAYTGDPPLVEITDATCESFVLALGARTTRPKLPGQGRPLSPNTVRKHCTHLQLMLDLAGPRTRTHRKTACLIDEPPYLERPPARPKPPRDALTLCEISAWLAACRTTPRCRCTGSVPTGRWHRALILVAYNTGLRLGTLLKLRWEWIGAHYPDWITVPPEAAKHAAGGDFYCNAAARAALWSIQATRPLVFPWLGVEDSTTWLHASRRRIQAAAGLPPARRLGWHALRKALATWLAQRNPLVASKVLGHRGGMTADHYVHPDVVRELLEQLPQPTG